MYNKKVQLKHNEKLAIVDVETGEIKEVPNGSGNPRSQYHNADKTFSKRYVLAWRLLATQTTATEFNAANILSDKARAFTNSLIPLNDETTLVKLSEELKINRNIVGKIIEKLFNLGVIARFQVSNYDEGTQEFELAKYWVFNPYLSFNGKVIDKGLSELFANTFYAKL